MTAKPPNRAVAFSYVRFSTPEQMKGDSLRRQTQATEEWCQRNGIILDTSTTLHDLGKSAFAKAKKKPQEDDDGMASVLELADLVNPDRRALAGFLELIKKRLVPRGAFLVIENLDRLTRDDTVPATHLLTGILLAGVKVVQLKPLEQVLTERSDGYAILMAVMEMSRGNSESKIKSERIGGAWDNKREHARDGVVMTRNLPAWVQVQSIDRDRYTLALIPERAKVISRIFTLAASGLGTLRIAQKLTEEGVPAFARHLDEKAIARYEERRRIAGKPPLTDKERADLNKPGHLNWRTGEWVPSASWNSSYILDILTDRRALGECSPRARRGLADGPAIPNYFPPVVDEKTFDIVRAALADRKPLDSESHKGRRIGKHVDLFAKMVYDALDGTPYYTATKTEVVESRQSQRDRKESRKVRGATRSRRVGERRRSRILVNAPSVHGLGPKKSFPMPTFERAILSMLREIDPREILGDTNANAEVADLERRARWLVERQIQLGAELRHGDIPIIAQQLRELKDEENELAKRLDQARQLAAKPLLETWRDLLKLLDEDEDMDVRRRLRSAIARTIDVIRVIIVPRGRDRLAAVQIEFAGGGARRNYNIIHRPALWLGSNKGMRPARWYVNSSKSVIVVDYETGEEGWSGHFPEPDLRTKTGADEALGWLEKLPQDWIDRLLAEGTEIG